MNVKFSSLQVLVATMNEEPNELFEKMNLKSDALIINQCNDVSYKKINIDDNVVECYSLNDRGLSKSRNNAIMRASADIICIADDDMSYSATYKKDILEEFNKHPEADVIIFNVLTYGGDRESVHINKFKKILKHEYKDFGSVHFAIKREKLIANNIWFNIKFGSGSKINCGEDTIFMHDLLKKKFKVYKSPITIASVDMSSSSWFTGYNELFFRNKGKLVKYIYKHSWFFVILFLSIKNSKSKLGSYKKFFKLLNWYYQGAKEFSLK